MTLAANSATSFPSSTAQRAPSPRPRRSASTSTLGISLITLAALIALWFLAAHFEWASPLFLPSPGEVLTQFSAVWADGYANGTLLDHTLASLTRIAAALGVGIFLGIPLGLLMGLNRWVKGIFSVPIDLYWGLPPLAYLPLLIIWLGIGETSKIVLLSLSTFAPICFAAQAGVRSVPAERINAALSLGASRLQLFTSIILPSALPEIMTGLKIAIGAGLSTLVAAELIAAQSGLGYMIMSAANFLATDVVFVGLIVIAILAFAFTSGMRWLEHRLIPWKGKI
ncbi:ABC transporter permease subunit [Mesorhizobium qingshengii]|uniref:Taurine transport system permease protein n=1 Tax=Mesorhizobium qingshengii TaxID=1165689 RepID=A0A1G5ZMC5_9HYPH|nr:ABC transporter permease subunit [Mesorhizobium qingshengii]SDA95969.1 taurine transport system permease protein [Mesorhizobium qingshengii]